MFKNLYSVVSLFLTVVMLVTGTYIWTAIGLGFTLYVFARFLDVLGQKIPVIELMATLASLQWILGPFIEYRREFHHYRYQMYVDEPVYMSYIVPAVLAFWIGSNLIRRTDSLEVLRTRSRLLLEYVPFFPFYLIIVGILAPFVSSYVPASLKFFVFLLENVKYIGALYLLHSTKEHRWLIFWGIMLFMAVSSIATGYFHNLLLWSVLLSTFLVKEWQLSFSKKMAMALLAIFLAITVQSVKQTYRTMVFDKKYSGSKTMLFLSLTLNEWITGSIFIPSDDVGVNVRLNQGWIISAIMQNVPDYEPYAKGETIYEAITSSVLPRVLSPWKKVAGGRENFRRFTGLPIADETSMGISMAGEGYGNYGKWGGILFMFLWGLFVGWLWHLLIWMSRYYPTLLLWTPILFLQVIKAETEFAVVLNYLIKAGFLLAGVVWFIRKQFGIRV